MTADAAGKDMAAFRRGCGSAIDPREETISQHRAAG
jgi:hypothetical protein